MDHKRDSDHPSKKKCNQPDCQKSKCWNVHKTLMPTSNDVITNKIYKDLHAQRVRKNVIDKNELMHHRKREHPRNIFWEYFPKNTCRRSSNQGALCLFRHDLDQLHLSAPNVANAAPDKNIEFKKSHSYYIDKQSSKQLLNASNVGTYLIPSTRFKEKQQKN